MNLTAQSIPGKWRRIQLLWDSAPPGTTGYELLRDGVLWSRPGLAARGFGGYDYSIPGELYRWTLTALPSGEMVSIPYRAPAWHASPNVGTRRQDAYFFVFPDSEFSIPFDMGFGQKVLDEARALLYRDSEGKYRLDGTAFGWITMPLPIDQYCKSKAASGLWLYPDIWKCRLDGLAAARAAGYTPGETNWMVFNGVAASGYGWFLGATASNGYQNAGATLLAHEEGHALGLQHAASLTTRSTNMGPSTIGDVPVDLMQPINPVQGAGISGYGDGNSFMGGGERFTTLERALNGWIDPLRSRYVSTSGRYALYEARTPRFRAIEIRIPLTDPRIGNGWFYSFEYDASRGGANVRIHQGHVLNGAWGYQMESYAVNMWQPIRPGGDIFHDPYRGITVQATTMSPQRITLEVSIDSP